MERNFFELRKQNLPTLNTLVNKLTIEESEEHILISYDPSEEFKHFNRARNVGDLETFLMITGLIVLLNFLVGGFADLKAVLNSILMVGIIGIVAAVTTRIFLKNPYDNSQKPMNFSIFIDKKEHKIIFDGVAYQYSQLKEIRLMYYPISSLKNSRIKIGLLLEANPVVRCWLFKVDFLLDENHQLYEFVSFIKFVIAKYANVSLQGGDSLIKVSKEEWVSYT